MLFTFPSRYCALSVISSYLALEGGPPVFRQDFTCPALLFDGRTFPSTYRAVTCCGGAFHPASVDLHATEPVWAPPLSLTTTEGISVDFFSSGYLDVSVPRVSLRSTMYSSRGYANAWVSPFGIAMVKDPLRLAWHFRGLARPSSPADAKASPACIPSLKSCFPAIQLDLLLHEQLESTLLFLVLQVTLCLLLFRMLSPKFSICVHRLAADLSLRPGALVLELRRLELLTSSLQSWRSTS